MSHLRTHSTRGLVTPHSGAVAATFRLKAAEWDIELTENPGQLGFTIWECDLRLVDQDGIVRLDLSGPEKHLVDTLRDLATEVVAEAGLTVEWDRVDTGALAPGLSLATVLSVADHSPGFVRVRLTGPDLGRFDTPANLHFRLLLPPAGRTPAWPRVAETGRTVWPQGDDAPHRAVYTVAAHGKTPFPWIDMDVFRHAGSPTCDWLAGAPIGDAVGVLGPGGGGCPQAEKLWLFGDETALPAITRMIGMAQGEVQAILRAAPYDIGALAHDPRVTRCDDLQKALLAHPVADAPVAGGQVWFAGRADQARAARAHLLSRGWAKADICCAAYWD